ncbi:MAG TPA: hypothetical protein VKX28_11370 [Xanthobacteraceae bacterium]|nr:hypothetical protein [Xanthobacteraceae bacterium]
MNAANQQGLPAETVVKLVLAWAFVGIPLLVGVGFTLYNAMKLFQ